MANRYIFVVIILIVGLVWTFNKIIIADINDFRMYGGMIEIVVNSFFQEMWLISVVIFTVFAVIFLIKRQEKESSTEREMFHSKIHDKLDSIISVSGSILSEVENIKKKNQNSIMMKQEEKIIKLVTNIIELEKVVESEVDTYKFEDVRQKVRELKGMLSNLTKEEEI